MSSSSLPADVASAVRRALSEDVGSGDLTAELIPEDRVDDAIVICRDNAILCGIAWFNEVFQQLDGSVAIEWSVADGDQIKPDQCICRLSGKTRMLLTGERTALNFLQLLSGTATTTHIYVQALKGMGTKLLDTRKTIPGLRSAQKYAVLCGGGINHRKGLYDAILIKENHIQAAGSIEQAVINARALHRNIEVEVENLDELERAIGAGADRILLDNFDLQLLIKAVEINKGKARLEASGGIGLEMVGKIAETGVDYISIGDLTKNVQAIDFSMRITGN